MEDNTRDKARNASIVRRLARQPGPCGQVRPTPEMGSHTTASVENGSPTHLPPSRKMHDHYQRHAKAYADATRDVDMAPLYQQFLSQLPNAPQSSWILDAGCGSGRDARAFLRAGHRVAAFDGSAELAMLASEHTGLPICVVDFMSLDEATPLGVPAGTRFNGIWACASLLHVAESDQLEAWARLWAWLAPGGVVYASYKLGEGERVDELGRPFTDATEPRLLAWLKSLKGVTQVRTWVSSDQRKGASQAWLNALVHRESRA